MKPKYLTKSLFITAMDCPTKLYYATDKSYANQKQEDSFLLALAEGGFQVGELAKCYFSGGINIHTLDYEESLEATGELLKNEKATIYEGAIRYKDFFIRADILVKQKNRLQLIEVKAKSIKDGAEETFLNKNGSIASDWRRYLTDVAFQKYVMQKARPDLEVTAFLMLVDKQSKCPSDGLHQKFKVVKDEAGRKQVAIKGSLTDEDLAEPVLRAVNVDSYCEQIYEELYGIEKDMTFAEYADYLGRRNKEGVKIPPQIASICGKCEFTASAEEEKAGLKNGLKECWKEVLKWEDEDFEEPTVLEIWDCRKKDEFIQRGSIKMKDLVLEDISPAGDSKPGISRSQRQWIQVQKVRENDSSHWFDAENMRREMSSWAYPLHFIDFETYMPAIPFNKGRRPYEGIAFQYSHHIMEENGNIEHRGQYLNTAPGIFPNYDFIRHLKKELEGDSGSIFRYAPHENTYLNIIYRQLMEDENEIEDRDELCEFIKSITKSVKGSYNQWEGARSMIDLWELAKRYYYDPATGGSNSIKYVLPAILNSSVYLQNKYSRPIYGAADGIKSLNYTDWKWVEFEDGRVVDPYRLLPRMFEDYSNEELSQIILFSENDELRDGGEAMMAYARLQFEEMSDYERTEIQKALLQYCELDTLAMVMIVEGWKDMAG